MTMQFSTTEEIVEEALWDGKPIGGSGHVTKKEAIQNAINIYEDDVERMKWGTFEIGKTQATKSDYERRIAILRKYLDKHKTDAKLKQVV